MIPGAIYHFLGIKGSDDAWIFPPGDYRCLAVALDYRTRQQKVVYQGVNGKDDGQHFVACLSDWETQFVRIG